MAPHVQSIAYNVGLYTYKSRRSLKFGQTTLLKCAEGVMKTDLAAILQREVIRHNYNALMESRTRSSIVIN